jgi:hypothetical protein
MYGGGDRDAFLVKVEDTALFLVPTVPYLGSTAPICAGSAVSIPYTSNSGFNAGNNFTAQLSNAAGSFAAPYTLGSAIATNATGIIAGQIPFSVPAGTGYRFRILSSNPGITGPDNGTNITVLAAPAAPVITRVGATLVSNPPAVLWYGPGGLIPGATTSPFYPATPGTYYAVTTGSNGCPSLASNSILMTGAMLNVGTVGLDAISIYPNPTKGEVMIDWGANTKGRSVSVYSPTGQQLMTVAGSGTQQSLDMSGLANGLYFIVLEDRQGGKRTERVVLAK